MRYAELHAHTYYSAMDGTSSSLDYMKRAKELGIEAVAQTDHGTLAGHREHQRAARETGIKPLLGVEGYITKDRFDRTAAGKRKDGDQVYNHMILIAQNEKGLTNLRKIDEISWSEGFYSKNRFDFEVLEEYNEGLLATSGCLSGLIPKAIENGNFELADAFAQDFKRIFGDRFFIELMSHNPVSLNKALVEIADRHGFLPVVTSDCHHARKEDLWVQEAMLILSTSPDVAKDFDFSKSQKMEWLERFNYLYPDRKMTFQDFNLHLNSFDEHIAGLAKHGIGREVIENTAIVADMVDFEDYPYYENLDLLPKTTEGDVDDLLRKKVFAGLRRLGKDKDQEYIDRAERELGIIKEKGFSAYFHIADKAISWAKKQDILTGPGRGSGAGSLVVYALGMTKVDPIQYGLIFERFIDISRDDWPDLDLDFMDTRREEVKAYMRRAYNNVASIATFGYFKDKGTIRDAARVLKIPLGEVNKALKAVDSFEQFEKDDSTKGFRNKYPEVAQLAKQLQGKIRSTGMHAGGLVVSNRALSEIVPVQTAVIPNDPAKTRVPVVAYDMNEVANVGLIKFDFLGLKALGVIKDALDMIKERTGNDIDIDNLPMDDQKVFQMLSEGRTKMVFQCEAAPYTKMLVDMGGVKNFDELVASNALVRPGAANSSFGEKYINGKNGLGYDYIHANTKWFTEETYGSVLYQEQQMYLCTELAGMSMADANKVRKAIGKKKADELAKWKEPFIEGAAKAISQQAAEALWHDLEAAGEYSFNKSHAVAYSMISYQTAWLKVHYPLEFVAANLKNEANIDSRVDYLVEAKRMGLRVLMPHVNHSEVDISIQPYDGSDVLRLGLSDVKYISSKLATRLIEQRPFRNYQHLVDVVTTKGSGLNTRVLESLNKIGGASFSDNPLRGDEKENYYEYLSIPAFNQELPMFVTNQFRPLDEFTSDEAFVSMGMVRKVKVGTGWARVDIVDESGSAGVFTEQNHALEIGKMYVFLIANNSIVRYISVQELTEGKGEDFRKFLGATSFPDIPDEMLRVVAFKPRTTKAGRRMATVVFATNTKELISALVFPGQFMVAFARCKEGSVVAVDFKQTDDGTVFVDKVIA